MARRKRKRNRRQRRADAKKAEASLKQRIDYYQWIASPGWRAKRKFFIALAKHKCETCGSPGPLQVHHKHYRTLGKEKSHHVEVLCRSCHELKHEPDGVISNDPLSVAYRELVASL